MGKIAEYSTAPSPSVPKVASSVNLNAPDKEATEETNSGAEKETDLAVEPAVSSSSSSSAFVPLTMMPKHSSVMGHLVLIAQV